MTTAAEKLISRLRFLALKNILCQPVSWFDLPKCSTGHLITRLARDAPLIKSVTGLRIGQVVTSFMTLAAALSIAFIYGWKLAIILLFAAPLLFASASHQASLIRKNQTRDSALMDEAGKLASECIQNIKTVQALGKEHSFLKLYCNYLLVPFEENMKQALVYGITFAFSQMVVYIMYAAAFRFGGYLIGIEEMVPSEVFRVFFALSFCATALGNNSAYYQDFTKAKVAARNIFELITVKSDVDPMSDYGVKPDIKGKITFRNVKFCYPNRESISVLDNLNLTISPGETIAIVGGSGCGKSTIVSLIERFYTPNSGEILIDDADIRVMNLAYLRSVIGLVGQEPVLFDCSLKENILYGAIALRKPIMDHEIIKAAKMANIHDFIASLPQGYETYCGENGTQLSGGQKQRIAIARALVRDPKILILDEATSALDNENEKIVQASLNKARIGRTTIVIAHRLSTIKAADKIAVLDQGKIIEIGTPEELEQSDGFYYKLIKGQQI
ncbi:hypothetical protein AAG570_009555 [Ranatra chinensis]|uniref:Uncharacterized protein n=1 Tax=Ranatra chinensis TaxID=642074 RepID=A0ABD0YPF0_9HEMI